MGIMKRRVTQNLHYNKRTFDLNLYNAMKEEIEKMNKQCIKKSQYYTLLRSKFTKMGYKPFTIMAHYQTYMLKEQKKQYDSIRDAFEAGVKIAATIAQRKYGRK